MGNATGGIVTVSIANRSNKTILYRYYDEIAYTRFKGELTAGNFRAGVLEVEGAKANVEAFGFRKNEGPGLNRLPPRHWSSVTLDTRGQPVVYVTIMTEDGEIIWNNNPQDKRRNIVILEDLQIRAADDVNPFQRHLNESKIPPISTRFVHPQMQSLAPREALNMYHSKEIDLDDFVKLMQLNRKAEKEENELRNKFKLFDLNGDGKLDFEEMKLLLAVMGKTFTDDSIRRLIRAGDMDGDNCLDFDEFHRLMRHLDMVK